MINEELLLTEVATLQVHTDEIELLKGEKFNIFSIIRRERDEVVIHNRFIAEMLDPNGSHGLGEIPLNCFREHLKSLEKWSEVEANNDNLENHFSVKAEHYLGPLNQLKTKGGYIDVALLSNDFNIFIESKIGAGEQQNQLLRYRNDSENKPNLVCYLTLNGEKAHKAGNLVADKHYLRLSYEKDIINWLTEVNRYAVDLPILRETIKQYINLIKKLTGQLYNQQMQEKLIELMSRSSESYKAAKLIHDNFSKVEQGGYTDFFKRLEISLSKKFDRTKDSRNDAGFATLFSTNIEGKEYNIGIQIELSNGYLFVCAIEKKQRRITINQSPEFNPLANSLYEKLNSYTGARRTAWCLIGTFSFNFDLQDFLTGAEDSKKAMLENVINVYTEISSVVLEIKD